MREGKFKVENVEVHPDGTATIIGIVSKGITSQPAKIHLDRESWNQIVKHAQWPCDTDQRNY